MKKNHFKSKALLFCSHLVTSLHVNVNLHPWCRSQRNSMCSCCWDHSTGTVQGESHSSALPALACTSLPNLLLSPTNQVGFVL